MQVKQPKICIITILLLLWQLLCVLNLIPQHKIPSPYDTLLALKSLTFNGLPAGYTLLNHMLESVYRVFWGFLIAASISIPLGIFMGWSKSLRDMLNPLIELLRPIPPLAWIPLAIFWFGIGIKSAAFIIFLGAFFPILLSTVSGVLSVDTVLIEASRTLGARPLDIYRKILIPGAMPSIFTGLRIGMGIAWMTLIAAEFTGVKTGYGLGYLIMVARDIQRPDLIVAGMVIIGITGYLLDTCVIFFEHRILRWQ